MDSILKLHQHNINQLKGHIRAKGPSVIHGDGNIYPAQIGWTPESGEMNHSYNNEVFSNPDREEATYHKTYHSISEVPDTVEELEQELIANRFKIASQKRTEANKVTSNSFDAYEEPVKKADIKKADNAGETKSEVKKVDKTSKADKGDKADNAGETKSEADQNV